MRIDYLPCGRARAPLFLFIHGGYWQRNDKAGFAFVAEGPLAQGIHVALVGYTLAPEASRTEIVAQMRAAMTFLSQRSDELGFDRDRRFVGGWSDGGHLTAAICDHPAFRGGLPISGIFDLEPIALNYLNDKLRLSQAEIATLSPIHSLAERASPLRLFAGSEELPELRRQSQAYATAARARGLPVAFRLLQGQHHYSILDEIARPDGVLTLALRDLIAATPDRRSARRT
jgi:arylformamidase